MRALLWRIARASGGRRGTWTVLAAWLVVAVALGPLAGRLGDVEDTGRNAFLPRGAESTQVNTELDRFRTDQVTPAVVVYTGDGAHRKAAEDRSAFAPYAADGERVSGPIRSDDGKAWLVLVPLDAEDEITDRVDTLRDLTADHPPGVNVHVGGPAGALTDQVAVFDDLDMKLLVATALIVTVLLLLIYRSPILWLLPLLSVGFAAVPTQAGTYLLARHADLPVNPQSSGVLMVLLFGVGTDYALLLIARYREELHRHEDRYAAMRIALRRSGPAILASAGTIALGLACLAFADLNNTRSLGLVGVVGVVCALLAMVTVLPALLAILGRWVFWPFVPRYGTPARRQRTVWSRIGAAVARRPRRSWLVAAAVTGLLALGTAGIDMGLRQAEMFQDEPDSVLAQKEISAHFPSGASDPVKILTDTGDADRVRAAVAAVDGVARVEDDGRTPDGTRTALATVLKDAPDSRAAEDTVERLRAVVHRVAGADALVGGTTAETLDTRRATGRDLATVIPIVLLVVLGVLVRLLRALIAPVVLLATVVLSFLAALGAGNLLFVHALGHAGIDWSIPLLGFVFLVSLGIDYNIFLMHRVREETEHRGHVPGVLEGLTSTGGVITSAGVVLAATFAVFSGLPMVTMAQMGVVIGVGVLLDTLLVRTVLVPALALDLGRWFWWPGSLFRRAPVPARTDSGNPAQHLPEPAPPRP